MTILARPLCYILGHRRARRRVWHDQVDLRAPCVRCGMPLIRSVDKGWRPFRPGDEHPDRISRDAYREQMKRETDLRAASGTDPEHWARLLIATFGHQDRPPAIGPAGLFDGLIADLASEPAFAQAITTGRLDLPARVAVGSACARLIGAARPLPGQFADPLARYLFAREQSARSSALRIAAPTQD